MNVSQFRSHAQNVLQQLVVTGKLTLALDINESGSHLSEDTTMNVKIVPRAEENLTVIKKKKRRKPSVLERRMSKTPKRVVAMGYGDEDQTHFPSKKSQILSVSEKGRHLVQGPDSMSEENM